MIRLCHQETCELLDGGRLTPAFSGAAFAGLTHKSVTKFGGREPFAYGIHKCDNGTGKIFGMAILVAKNFDESFQA